MIIKFIHIKKFLTDIFFSFSGLGLTILILQLFINPLLSNIIGGLEYGKMQSILAITYLISGTLGNTLSTLVLAEKHKYDNIGERFNVFYLCSIPLIILLTPISIKLIIGSISIEENIIIVLISISNFLIIYSQTELRIKRNYKKIFIGTLLTSIGYGIGYYVFLKTRFWGYIFFISNFITFVYYMLYTHILLERIAINISFKSLLNSLCCLLFSVTLNKCILYADKLLLFPLLGGEAVSIYYVANLFGKLLMQIIEPISNIILSYIAKFASIPKHLWNILYLIIFGFMVIVYFISVSLSHQFLGYFYPHWINSAIDIIPITVASACIASIISILYPFTLKTISYNKQTIVNFVGIIILIVVILCSYKSYGLTGCAVASLFSNIARLIIIIFYVYKENNKHD